MNLFNLIRGAWSAHKLHRASVAEIADDRCVACDSVDLETLGEGAYRCLECGYEGGSGLEAMRQRRHREALERMPVGQRRASARDDLEQARSLLAGAVGTLDGAKSAAVHDLLNISAGQQNFEGEGGEKYSMLTSAMGAMEEARALMRDALFKLTGHHGPVDGDAMPAEFAAWTIDLYMDNPLSDLIAHGRIGECQGHCKGMLAAVDAAIELHFGRPG